MNTSFEHHGNHFGLVLLKRDGSSHGTRSIGEREQHAKPEGLGDREPAFGLVGADHQRDLLGLTDVEPRSGAALRSSSRI